MWYKKTKKTKFGGKMKRGTWVFSFDKETEFNFWRDYPHKLTPEQKRIFDAENQYIVTELKGQ